MVDNFRAEANKHFDFNFVMFLVDSKVIIIIETTIVLLDFIEKLVANNEVDFSNQDLDSKAEEDIPIKVKVVSLKLEVQVEILATI